MQIKKAVFPVASYGTRFLPMTKACPKEMLPIIDKPLIQYAVEEAYEAGIRQMIFVTGRNKRAIEDHFDVAYELETELELSGKDYLKNVLHNLMPQDMDCVYIRQHKALGLGHAIYCAKNIIGEEPFAVLLADDLMTGNPGVLKQLIDLFNVHQTSIIAVTPVDEASTPLYGIVGIDESNQQRLLPIQSIVEKPCFGTAPSNLAVVGRYLLTPEIFVHLNQLQKGHSSEIQLTDAISKLLHHQAVLAYQYHGKRYDCGNKLGLLQANVALAMTHPEIGILFQQWMTAKNILDV